MISTQSSLRRRFTRYGIVGLATNVSAYVVFLGLLKVGLKPVWATGIVYVVAITVSYSANYIWSFQSNAGHLKDLPRYLLSYSVGLGTAVGSMAVLSLWMSPVLAQILVICLTAVVIFSCLEMLKFGRSREQ